MNEMLMKSKFNSEKSLDSENLFVIFIQYLKCQIQLNLG